MILLSVNFYKHIVAYYVHDVKNSLHAYTTKIYDIFCAY